MPKMPVPRNPIRAHTRKTIAARRVGEGNKCSCGEDRPEALLPGRKPTICAKCERTKRKVVTEDRHHVAGKANDPTTIRVPANDHRARLSVDQYDWPRPTLENPDGSPLLASAACIRGFVDTMLYLIEKILLPKAETLETLDAYLKNTLGPKWWENSPLVHFAPKPKRDGTP
jgi:hypothetical protein